jgi:hypothetical protein
VLSFVLSSDPSTVEFSIDCSLSWSVKVSFRQTHALWMLMFVIETQISYRFEPNFLFLSLVQIQEGRCQFILVPIQRY